VCLNALKKHLLIYGKRPKGKLTITSIETRQAIIMYRNTVIKAWNGKYQLRGDPNLIQTAYETGLGSKTPRDSECSILISPPAIFVGTESPLIHRIACFWGLETGGERLGAGVGGACLCGVQIFGC